MKAVTVKKTYRVLLTEKEFVQALVMKKSISLLGNPHN
jgi:hypothetical protein